MKVRKLAGWCLILLGTATVFQAIYLHARWGESVGVLFVVVVSLLFIGGAALLWLKRAPQSTRP
jgi:hypothetical protein